jgi:phosphate-selective porin OprO/OprP
LTWFVVVGLVLGALPAAGQSPPAWPTPPPAPAPTPTPEPAAAPAAQDGELVETDPQPSASEPQDPPPEGAADEPGSEPPGEEETNPGEVAFTDFRPFDFESIEHEPFDSKWQAFVAGIRGITRYSLFDGQVKFRLGGRFQIDGTTGTGSALFEESYSPIDSDAALRRGVIYAVGRIRDYNFSVGFDFGRDANLDSAWIEGAKGGLEVWGIFLGKLRVGYVSEPFSLERQTSSYNLGFLERSLPVQTIAPGSNVGALVHNSGRKGRTSWAAGLFSVGVETEQNASTSVLSLSGRLTHLLVYQDEGRELLHVGASVSSRSPAGSEVRYRSRPEARFVGFLADTGDIEASHVTLLGLEVAAVRGPLWVAAEYVQSDVSAQLVGDPSFHGSYAQVGWFLTGESRRYRTNSGSFDRTLPAKQYRGGWPFKKANGGAWELTGRISHVDLDNADIEGGELTNVSAALSWYPDPSTRVALNYIYAMPEDRGSASIFLLRVQFNPW